MRRATVLICDDHPLMGQGIRALLKPSYSCVGIVNDPRELLDTLIRTQPDVLLLDLTMPHRNGLDLLQDVKKHCPGVRVIIVTMHVDRALVELAMQNGASAFSVKSAPAEELNAAITHVLNSDRFYVSPSVPKKTTVEFLEGVHPALARLTPRQLQILQLLANGRTTAEMSAELALSPKTIEFHRAGIRRALGITTEWGLTRFALLLLTVQPGRSTVEIALDAIREDERARKRSRESDPDNGDDDEGGGVHALVA